MNPLLSIANYGLQHKQQIITFGKKVGKAVLISSVVAFTFRWLYELELKVIHLERDIYYNLPEHNDKPNLS